MDKEQRKQNLSHLYSRFSSLNIFSPIKCFIVVHIIVFIGVLCQIWIWSCCMLILLSFLCKEHTDLAVCSRGPSLNPALLTPLGEPKQRTWSSRFWYSQTNARQAALELKITRCKLVQRRLTPMKPRSSGPLQKGKQT